MEEEPEPALGNGGLGRLAACFLDSLSTLGIPSIGCTIRYEYGLFRQKIVDGQQVELPDPWLQDGNVWEIPVTEDICQVQFGGDVKEYEIGGRRYFALENAYTIDAVPYDMPVVGYGTGMVNTLRTWSRPQPRNLRSAHLRPRRVRQGHGRDAHGRGHQQGALPRGQPLGGQNAAHEAAVFLHLRHAADGAQEVQEALRNGFQPPAGQGGLPHQRHAPRPCHPGADAAADRPGRPWAGTRRRAS